MRILPEILQAVIIGLVRYACAGLVALTTCNLICESAERGITLATAILGYMITSW